MPNKCLQKTVSIILLVLAVVFHANAQQKDSTSATTQKTSKAHKPHPYPNPARAMIYSAILPGLGQAYNKKYWKIPIIYTGLGTMTYFIIWNNNEYNTFYSALKTRNNGGIDPYYNIYSKSDLVTIQGYYNHYFWLSIIGAGLVYILNVVDANVDAQLHNFDVSDNLSINISPQIYSNPLNGKCSIQPGFCLIKRF